MTPKFSELVSVYWDLIVNLLLHFWVPFGLSHIFYYQWDEMCACFGYEGSVPYLVGTLSVAIYYFGKVIKHAYIRG